jgi:BON domain
MLRALVRIIVVVVIVVAAAAFLLGYRWGGGRSQVTTTSESTARQETAVGTRGDRADTSRALTGTVINDAQHRRAIELARETDGVSTVVDHLSVGSAN